MQDSIVYILNTGEEVFIKLSAITYAKFFPANETENTLAVLNIGFSGSNDNSFITLGGEMALDVWQLIKDGHK